jgi:hypothetical protein
MAMQVLHLRQPFPLVLCRGKYCVSCLAIKKLNLIRLIIPIKRVVLDEDTASKPIPTLSEKQFVVASSRLSMVEERAQRELFWYREELFKCVSARWHEVCLPMPVLHIFQ